MEDFEVEIVATGQVVRVGKEQSILQALRAHGLDPASSCEAGTCGTCRTRYLEGVPDHQDFVLDTDEQSEFVMICVSRSLTPRLKLVL
jgi:phthalate 4,5-dioxygenase reductase subunit